MVVVVVLVVTVVAAVVVLLVSSNGGRSSTNTGGTVLAEVFLVSGGDGGLELTFTRKGTPLILLISLFSFLPLKC